MDYWNMKPMKYWNFPKTYKEDKMQKAKELCLSTYYIGSEKIDGCLGIIIKNEYGQLHLRTEVKDKEGKYQDKIDQIPLICFDLDYIPNNTVLIGEINSSSSQNKQDMISIFKHLERKSDLHFYIFDVLLWNNQELHNSPIEKRVEVINKKMHETPYTHPCIYKSGQELWDLYCNTIDNGKNGIIITRKDCPYNFNKKNAWTTLKMDANLQYTINAFVDGRYKIPNKDCNEKDITNWLYWINFKTGKKIYGQYFDNFCKGEPVEPVNEAWFKNQAAAVSFSAMKKNNIIHIGWLTNISNELKEQIISMPEKWIGKVAEINAIEFKKNNDCYSLNHGKVKKWIDDKKPEDCQIE